MDTASIVSDDDVRSLPKADVVYSWGVLHHTGAMWQGITNAASLVKPGGLLYLMLYRDAVLAPVWKRVKWCYVKSPSPESTSHEKRIRRHPDSRDARKGQESMEGDP